MRLLLRTRVASPPTHILAGFDRTLFLALAPPFPKMRLHRFDGSKPGNQVEIELVAGPKRWRWTSLITEAGQLPDGSQYFVDEGQLLPQPLRFWRHRHLITPDPRGRGSIIVEDIEYSTNVKVLDALLYPLMWAQFAYRRPVYRRFFGKP